MHASFDLAQTRRGFLRAAGLGAIGAAVVLNLPRAMAQTAKRLRGIFPIGMTPFTTGNALDLEAMREQVRFINRGGVHGLVWPQIASEWSTLSEAERLAGAEAIATTGRALPAAIVLGVQGPTTAAAVAYARHAERVGADAIISLPPAGENDAAATLAYYREVGAATRLPLFVQAVGQMSVETILEMYRAIPTLRFVKDEAGQPLARVRALREGSGGQLADFSGGHGRTLIDEMIRGFSGSMPTTSFADLYALAWDHWQAGRRREAIAAFGNASVLIGETDAYGDGAKYILHLRGVFSTWAYRPRMSASGATPRVLIDEGGQAALREMLALMRPYLRG